LTTDVKDRVSKEAAILLYFGAEKEFKQAKTRAAKTLGYHILPSNRQVALELDKIAEENEGAQRKERLVEMRKEALDLMKLLRTYSPVLIGSVWRGTARVGSDIDIAVYTDEPQKVGNLLKAEGVRIQKECWTTVNKHGKTLASLHVYAENSKRHVLEIVVRSVEEANAKRKCEIFGDEMKGLKIKELEKVLQNNPAQKFIPV